MNQEVKAKWLTALRSGDYKQAQGALKDNTGFCCLGVLCDVYDKEHKQDNWTENSIGDGLHINSHGLPSATVMKWAGLPTDETSLGDNNPKTSIPHSKYTTMRLGVADLNDSGNYNFNQIADIIERDL